eukprot:2315322-Amphidinium_carterae.1
MAELHPQSRFVDPSHRQWRFMMERVCTQFLYVCQQLPRVPSDIRSSRFKTEGWCTSVVHRTRSGSLGLQRDFSGLDTVLCVRVCVCACASLFTAWQLEKSQRNCCKNTKTTAAFQPVALQHRSLWV